MAIPASGSVSFSQIQTEWGGSNPISLNEYYSGSLPSGSTSSSVTPTTGLYTNSIYNPGSKYVPAYTTYYRTNGFKNSNINITAPGLGSSSATWTTTTGRSASGNAGAIPSSGAIQMNHFRGSSAGTSSNLVTYGLTLYGTNTTSASGPFSCYLYFWIAGTYGTSGSGATWSNVPFRWIDSAAIAGFPATRWYGSDAHVNNGANTGKNQTYHDTFPTIGSCTRYIWITNFTSAITMSGTWTLTVQT